MSDRKALKRRLQGMILEVFDSETACAQALGWPKQRLNKIVNGLQEPKLPDVAALGRILGKPEEVREAFVMYWAFAPRRKAKREKERDATSSVSPEG